MTTKFNSVSLHRRQVQQQNVKLELDIGARCNVLPKYLYEKLNYMHKFVKTNTRLVTWWKIDGC